MIEIWVSRICFKVEHLKCSSFAFWSMLAHKAKKKEVSYDVSTQLDLCLSDFEKAKCLMNSEVAILLEHKFEQFKQMSDDSMNHAPQWVI